MAVDFPGRRLPSSLMPPLPGVMVTEVTEAWEVTAATERTKEAERGSSLISPPFFSCRNSRYHISQTVDSISQTGQKYYRRDWMKRYILINDDNKQID